MKLIIFDIDGTLVNSLNTDDQCFFDTFDELHNINISKVDFTKYKEVTSGTDLALFKHIFNEYFTAPSNLKDAFEFKEFFVSKLKSAYTANKKIFKEIDGAKAFVESLQKNPDVNVAIATGCFGDSALIKLKAIGLDTYSFPISSSDVHPLRKDIILNAMNLAEEFYASSGYEKVIYIGDGLWDYQATQLLNIDFIGVDFNKNKILANNGVEKIVNNFKGDKILELLELK